MKRALPLVPRVRDVPGGGPLERTRSPALGLQTPLPW